MVVTRYRGERMAVVLGRRERRRRRSVERVPRQLRLGARFGSRDVLAAKIVLAESVWRGRDEACGAVDRGSEEEEEPVGGGREVG